MNNIKETIINALGSPSFSADKVFEALKDVKQNRSTAVLLNILPELEAFAKERYADLPAITEPADSKTIARTA